MSIESLSFKTASQLIKTKVLEGSDNKIVITVLFKKILEKQEDNPLLNKILMQKLQGRIIDISSKEGIEIIKTYLLSLVTNEKGFSAIELKNYGHFIGRKTLEKTINERHKILERSFRDISRSMRQDDSLDFNYMQNVMKKTRSDISVLQKVLAIN